MKSLSLFGPTWQTWSTKINAMSLRERAILFVVVAVLILVITNHLLIDPAFAKQKMLADRIKQEQAQIAVLSGEISQLIAGKMVDPDAANKRLLQDKQQQLAAIDSSVQTTRNKLVPPEKMGALVEEIIKRNRNLQLISLKSLPTTNVLDEIAGQNAAHNGATAVSNTAKKNTQNGVIYKHEIELVVQGSYLDMITYMRQLQQMPQQVYWDTARLQVEDYPKANLTLRVFTLSLDESWLNL